MNRREGLLILGCGGHARSVADVALAIGYRRLLFIDDNARPGEQILGHPVQCELPRALPDSWGWIAAAGDNRVRQEQSEAIGEGPWPADAMASVIAPSATIGAGAILGAGAFVGHHAHIGPMARLGTGVIVNTSAIVEHDCMIADYAHVSVHATVAGKSRVGCRTFICTGSTVIDGICIGDDIILGAGAVAVVSLDRAATYVGVPARMLPLG
jgi:sugar O-acyltransferase (sialic acid O-acetyltransferase NeuD family)